MLSQLQNRSAAGRIKAIKNSNDTIDLPVCSAVPQPSAPPRTLMYGIHSHVIFMKSNIAVHVKVWVYVHLSEKTQWDVAQIFKHSSLTDDEWSVHTLIAFLLSLCIFKRALYKRHDR
jgi:hypothetical protein